MQQKNQWGPAQFDGSLNYKRGIKAFGATAAPEEFFGEGTHWFRLVTADVQLAAPFQLNGQRWQYQGNWRWQNNRTPLTPQDRFSIGGRYTVRGFDGASALSSERGWLLRNEVSTVMSGLDQQIYLSLDQGRVSGPSAQNLPGRSLTGWSLGLRGKWTPLHVDVFAGAPMRKPQGFRTAHTTYGLSLNASF